MLNEYKAIWQGQPHVRYPRQVSFVMAENEDNARLLIIDHIERAYGISMKTIHSITLYEKPTVGYVK